MIKESNSIENIFESSSDIILESKKLSSKIEDAVILIAKAIKRGNKIVLFGNGGSAADAQHMAAEFIGRFQKERKRQGSENELLVSNIQTFKNAFYVSETSFNSINLLIIKQGTCTPSG